MTAGRKIAGKGAGAGLTGRYRPLPGIADEMIGPDGTLRPAWRRFAQALDRMRPEELPRRFARSDQYLHDAGVYYRFYDGGGVTSEREWPLAHMPVLIDEKEWNGIARALQHRAELFERIVADIYGRNQLVADGLLPAGLIADNPEFLRPLVGVRPASGHFLHFCAFDLGRGPGGDWWVLGDRMQAPSGAGFALENRVATTRAFADIYTDMNVHRVAGFFRRYREALEDMSAGSDGPPAIMSPGPLNETYFEHAYIARYLGLVLLEGEDLTVADGKLMVRTVSGLRPITVLWRRIDAAFMDPLELRGDSRIGTPGFVEALRNGSVSLVNALGSGILETRALLAFLPGISRSLTGAELELPSIATWWCGQEAERERVVANLDRMLVGPAMSTRLAFEDGADTLAGAMLDKTQRADLIDRIERNGRAFVGQEAVSLSTTPVHIDGRLEPRPFILRVFAARTGDGWTVFPGGFGRVGTTLDTAAIAMQKGGKAADVWIVSSGRVQQDTLFPSEQDSVVRLQPGSLPSRAAENLLWLGRYIERTEGILRTLRAYHTRLAETLDVELPLLKEMRAYLEEGGIDVSQPVPDGLVAAMESAVRSAGQIRDRFSPDGWLALRDLSRTLNRFANAASPGDAAARTMTILLRKLAGFSGLVHENMYRFTGWRFLEVGRRLERALQLGTLMAHLGRKGAPDGALEMMLEIGDSVLTHRRQYSVRAGRKTVIDLLVLDPLNPRSLLFQLERLRIEIDHLPKPDEAGHLSAPAREVLRIHTALAIEDHDGIDSDRLDVLVADLRGLYFTLSATYFPQ